MVLEDQAFLLKNRKDGIPASGCPVGPAESWGQVYIRSINRLPADHHAGADQETSSPNTLAALLSRLSEQLNATSPGATARISQAAASCTLS